MKKNQRISHSKQKIVKRRNESAILNKIYSEDGAYKVFTQIDITDSPMHLNPSVPYNYILKNVTNAFELELSYIVRTSDLVLITINSESIKEKLIPIIKRFMPTTIIVYSKEHRKIANNLSKTFGDIKTCEIGMLNLLLKDISTKNTNICENRPFMVAHKFSLSGNQARIEGFMKKGLVSNKVIINGTVLGIIDNLVVDDVEIEGASLIDTIDEKYIKKIQFDQENEKEDVYFENSEECSFEESDEEIFYYQPDKEIDPDLDLIEKYKEYRGVRNLATCTFNDVELPSYYKDLLFINRFDQLKKYEMTRETKTKPNKYVILNITLSDPIRAENFVLFNLFEYETKNTILNYEFKIPTSLGKHLMIDNGIRIFNSMGICSKNCSQRVFIEESDICSGIVSFLGPFSFFTSSAYCVDGENVIKIHNGESYDRIFLECVELFGKPLKIFKRHCVIKGIFNNKEQVEYFSTIKLEAENENIGFIKKPLGTKGLFKAFFTHKLKMNEKVKISLYKRKFLE